MRIEKKIEIYDIIIIAIAIGMFPVAAHECNFAYSRCNFFEKIAQETADFLKDGVWIYRNLFSVDSVKIITTATPFYLSARFADEDMHTCFYDKCCHKNRRQLPSAFIKGVDKTISATVFSAAALSIFSPNKRLRVTSRVFAVGLISGLFLKDIMKSAKINANLRPWHECFSSVQRTYGGFPSGHMFEITYMTTLFGLEYGLSAWIILGIFSGCMAAVSISSNRHYLSQVIGGTALGVMYGVASYKRVRHLVDKSLGVRFVSNKRFIGVSCNYMF